MFFNVQIIIQISKVSLITVQIQECFIQTGPSPDNGTVQIMAVQIQEGLLYIASKNIYNLLLKLCHIFINYMAVKSIPLICYLICDPIHV